METISARLARILRIVAMPCGSFTRRKIWNIVGPGRGSSETVAAAAESAVKAGTGAVVTALQRSGGGAGGAGAGAGGGGQWMKFRVGGCSPY